MSEITKAQKEEMDEIIKGVVEPQINKFIMEGARKNKTEEILILSSIIPFKIKLYWEGNMMGRAILTDSRYVSPHLKWLGVFNRKMRKLVVQLSYYYQKLKQFFIILKKNMKKS